MEIRAATICDLECIISILDSAREYQRLSGFNQWIDGYPSKGNVVKDIEAGGAMVIMAEKDVVGYAFLAIGDVAYEKLGDIWRFEGNYGVVHRLALSADVRGKGHSTEVLKLIENEYISSGINIIRVDTGRDNRIMQRIMEKNGYELRGFHEFEWGWRLAYEKSIML